MKPFVFDPLRLRALGKMNAYGERSGHSCFHSHSCRQPFGKVHRLRQRLFGFAEVAQLALVGRLADGERARVHVEAPPPQRKQLAGAESLGHVQRQQDAISERYRRQY
jgi:hypothetical protein